MKERTTQIDKDGQFKHIRIGDWSIIERRPTWGLCSSRELSKIYNVSLNTITSWSLRDKLSEIQKHPRISGNRHWYVIADVRSKLEAIPIDDIHDTWIKAYVSEGRPMSLQQAKYVVRHCHDILGVELA